MVRLESWDDFASLLPNFHSARFQLEAFVMKGVSEWFLAMEAAQDFITYRLHTHKEMQLYEGIFLLYGFTNSSVSFFFQ